MARIKPTIAAPVLHSLEEVDATLAEISARKRTLDLIETGLNEDVDALKLRAAEQCEPLKQEIITLEQSITRFADYNKAELFSKKKSISLTFGTIGYRASTKVKTLSKWTWERVLDALQMSGLNACIRTKLEVDKEALKGLHPDTLSKVGVKVTQEDVFGYELEEQELRAG